MVRLALGHSHRHAGNRHCVAPARLSRVLDLKKPTSLSPANGLTRCPRVDSRDVYRESTVGRGAHSQGATAAGDLGQSVHRRQIHATASASTVTNVVDVSHQSCEPDHRRRPLRGTVGHLPAAFRPRHRGARPSTDRPRGGYIQPRPGRHNNFATRSQTTRLPTIYCTIAIRSLRTWRE